jgi:enolase
MEKFKIKKIRAREILDSRGNPTVEVDLHAGSCMARASVPSGASTGSHEALELRDGGKRYLGKGVLRAVRHVNKIIAPNLIGRDVTRQEEIDEELVEMDGTEKKSKLGANALLGVSMAVCKAAAMVKGMPLHEYLAFLTENRAMTMPVPLVLVLEGGKHAHESSDIQEFMIAPYKEKTFRETIRIGSEIYHTIGQILKKMGENINVGFEGAYGPSMGSTDAVLEVIMKGIEEAGYAPKKEIMISLDSAANSFFKKGTYHLDGKKLRTEELVDWYAQLVKKYPVMSLEDGLAEDDWHGWVALTEKIGSKNMIIGDDMLVTNIKRIKKAIEMGACNSLLLKVNQIGTVSETIAAARTAFDSKWKVVVSHRAGETCDPFIADLTVGLGNGFIKTGAPCRSDRLAKYNQLLRIEEAMQER